MFQLLGNQVSERKVQYIRMSTEQPPLPLSRKLRCT